MISKCEQKNRGLPRSLSMHKEIDRRRLLSMIAFTMAWPVVGHASPMPLPLRRRLRLFNPHTGESFEGAYRDERGPIPSAIADLSVFLRDFHSSTIIAIDIAVLDFLAAVMDAVDVQSATILSAYRTPETNAMLARTTFGVADNSQHLYGRALDVRFDERLGEAMRAARAMRRGGVGWYPSSGFMHIDSGPVRNWDLDDQGLGMLLADGRRLRLNGVMADNRFPPELRRSGALLPNLQGSGLPTPALQRSGGRSMP